MDHHAPQLSNGLESDVPEAEVWCDEPDVVECHLGKFTSPSHSYADSTACCAEVIAEGLPEIEAFVGEFPYTVKRLGVVRFC